MNIILENFTQQNNWVPSLINKDFKSLNKKQQIVCKNILRILLIMDGKIK